jgi:hypothetical protein
VYVHTAPTSLTPCLSSYLLAINTRYSLCDPSSQSISSSIFFISLTSLSLLAVDARRSANDLPSQPLSSSSSSSSFYLFKTIYFSKMFLFKNNIKTNNTNSNKFSNYKNFDNIKLFIISLIYFDYNSFRPFSFVR